MLNRCMYADDAIQLGNERRSVVVVVSLTGALVVTHWQPCCLDLGCRVFVLERDPIGVDFVE
jgi:hypothetical protein